jgi:SSS family solute:Na+ symporter
VAVFAGLLAGVASAVFLMLSHRDPLFGVSAGFLALCLNFLIVAAVSLLTPARSRDNRGRPHPWELQHA